MLPAQSRPAQGAPTSLIPEAAPAILALADGTVFHGVSIGAPVQTVGEVVFNTADGRFVYNVTSTEIVFPDAIRIIDQTPDRTATLFACTPPGSTRQRIVIHLALSA